VVLSEIYGPEAVARAMEDAFVFQAFSCERPTPLRGHKSENNRRPDENGAQYDQAHTGAEAESTLVLKCPFESVVRG